MKYLRHKESKLDGDVGILERKHVFVSEVRHIGKEIDVLNESRLDWMNLAMNSIMTLKE